MTSRIVLVACALAITVGCTTSPGPDHGSGSGGITDNGSGSGSGSGTGSGSGSGSDGAICLSSATVDCQGNADCETCLADGECADGPAPIWRDNKCLCMGDPQLDCKLAWCCNASTHWDAAACSAAGTFGDFCTGN